MIQSKSNKIIFPGKEATETDENAFGFDLL